MSRCLRMDASFPLLPPGWSVDVKNGRYRASRTHVAGLNYTPGKEGWSGREGQPPGSSDIVVQLTPEGEGEFQEDASRLGRSNWGMPAELTGPLIHRFFRPWRATPQLIVDSVNVGCRMTLEECREVRHQGCRSLLWGCVEVQWLRKNVQWGHRGVRCGLREWVGRRRRNL